MILSKIFRLLLSVFSLLAFLLGLALAILGIWMIATKNLTRSVLNLVDTSKLPEIDKHKDEAEKMLNKFDILSTIGVVLLVIGGLIVLVSISGGIGAMCNAKFLLLVFFCIIGSLFVALLVSLIYFGTLKMRLADEIMTRISELQEKYFVSLISVIREKETAKAIITMSINFMHLALKCCGVKTIADARRSPSWRGSERRLMELAKEGAPLLAAVQSDESSLIQSDTNLNILGEATGKNIPGWLRDKLPTGFAELPTGVSIPEKLPPGFELPTNFASILKGLTTLKAAAKNFTALFNDILTIRTPITCCEMSGIDDLLKGKYDIKMAYQNIKEASCALKESNTGVWSKTCYQGILDYISLYQYIVVTVGIILCCLMGLEVLAAVWIFFCEPSEGDPAPIIA